jgi:hypothetical protein
MRSRKATKAAATSACDLRRFDQLGGVIEAEATPAKSNGQYRRLAVYDGQTHVGHVVERGGAFHAFDPDNNLVGVFDSQRAATRSLPRVSP